MQPERRANPRFACALDAELVTSDGQGSPRRVVDLSRGGISLVGADPIPTGTHVSVKLEATAEGGEHETVDVAGTIAWCTQTKDGTYQLGVKFGEAKGRDRSRRFEHLLELAARA